jgi:hypothetical protein
MILKSLGVLHPEIVLDRRGPQLERDAIRDTHSHISWSVNYAGERVCQVTDRDLTQLFERDMNLFRLMILTKEFKEQKAKVFAMGGSIMRALLEVDTAIPTETLPEKWLGYVVFPKGLITDGEHFYQGAYVQLDTAYNLGIEHSRAMPDEKAISIVAVSQDANFIVTMCDSVSKQKFIGDLGHGLESNASIHGLVLPEKGHQVFRAALSSVLFINSQEPDLREAKPLSNKTHTQARKTGLDYIEDITLPVTLVDWSWVSSPPQYGKQLWYQRPHWSTRWAGVGRTIPRAVFVRGSWHERKAGTEEN